jgi:hypothetical protein
MQRKLLNVANCPDSYYTSMAADRSGYCLSTGLATVGYSMNDTQPDLTIFLTSSGSLGVGVKFSYPPSVIKMLSANSSVSLHRSVLAV